MTSIRALPRFVLHYWIELKPGVEARRIASDLRLMILHAFDEAQIRLAKSCSCAKCAC